MVSVKIWELINLLTLYPSNEMPYHSEIYSSFSLEPRCTLNNTQNIYFMKDMQGRCSDDAIKASFLDKVNNSEIVNTDFTDVKIIKNIYSNLVPVFAINYIYISKNTN